jgi:hypothetical protein
VGIKSPQKIIYQDLAEPLEGIEGFLGNKVKNFQAIVSIS